MILLVLTSNIYNISNNIYEWCLVINNFTQFIKIILIICTIIWFLIQKNISFNKINAYEIIY